MAIYKNILITKDFLYSNPDSYFIISDCLERSKIIEEFCLIKHTNSIGFITKKFPDEKDSSFYRPEEYYSIFFEELEKIKKIIEKKSDKNFYIPQLGKELDNKFFIWEKLIRFNLINQLSKYDNVIFCWEK